MMTQEEIELIRTVLQDEVTEAEWELENDTTVGNTWTLQRFDAANDALNVFNREYPNGK